MNTLIEDTIDRMMMEYGRALEHEVRRALPILERCKDLPAPLLKRFARIVTWWYDFEIKEYRLSQPPRTEIWIQGKLFSTIYQPVVKVV